MGENKVDKSLINQSDLDKVAKLFLSNWYLFILLPLIAYGIASVAVHRMTETYAAKMQVILKSGEIYDYQSSLLRGLGASSPYKSYNEVESQKKVIKSTNLLSEVLDKLKLDVSYYIEGRLKTTEVFDNVPFEIVPYREDYGRGAYNRWLYVTIIDTNSVELRYQDAENTVAKTYSFDELILDNGFSFSIEKNREISQVAVRELSKVNYKIQIRPRPQLVSKYKG